MSAAGPFPDCPKHGVPFQYAMGQIICPSCRRERQTKALQDRAAIRTGGGVRSEAKPIRLEEASKGAQGQVFDAYCSRELEKSWASFLDGFGVAPIEPCPPGRHAR